jgi:HEAT repeat protein
MKATQQTLARHLLVTRLVHRLVLVMIGLMLFGQSTSMARATEPLNVLLQRIEAGSTYFERLRAAEAIRVYGEHAVPRLTELLTHEDEQARQFAALGLVRIGPDAAKAVPDLIAVLERCDQAIRHDAVVALEMIGPAAAPAIPALKHLADDADTRLAARAIFALAAIKTPEAIRALTVFLHSDQRQLQVQSLLALQELGPAAVVILPDLLRLGIQAPDFDMREQAFAIVGLVGEEAQPPLVELLETALGLHHGRLPAPEFLEKHPVLCKFRPGALRTARKVFTPSTTERDDRS